MTHGAFSWRGRLSRPRYLGRFGIVIWLAFLALLFVSHYGMAREAKLTSWLLWANLASVACLLAVLWAWVCMQAQRLRDCGVASRWTFLVLLPPICLAAAWALTVSAAFLPRDALGAPAELPPDQLATAVRLGQTFGVDPAVFMVREDYVADANALSDEEVFALAEKNQVMARWLSDPRNLAAVKADLPILHRIAEAIRAGRDQTPLAAKLLEDAPSVLAQVGLLLGTAFFLSLSIVPTKGSPLLPGWMARGPLGAVAQVRSRPGGSAQPENRKAGAVLLLTGVFSGTVIGSWAGLLIEDEVATGVGALLGAICGMAIGLWTFRQEPIRAAIIQASVVAGALIGTWIGGDYAPGMCIVGAVFGAGVAALALRLTGWQRDPPAAP